MIGNVPTRLKNSKGTSYKQVMKEFDETVIGSFLKQIFCSHQFPQVTKNIPTTISCDLCDAIITRAKPKV